MKGRKYTHHRTALDLKINTILANTTAIKENMTEPQMQVTVTAKSEKEPTAKPLTVRVGTKLYPNELSIFNDRLLILNINQSQYIKKLIDYDRHNNIIPVQMDDYTV